MAAAGETYAPYTLKIMAVLSAVAVPEITAAIVGVVANTALATRLVNPDQAIILWEVHTFITPLAFLILGWLVAERSIRKWVVLGIFSLTIVPQITALIMGVVISLFANPAGSSGDSWSVSAGVSVGGFLLALLWPAVNSAAYLAGTVAKTRYG